MDMQKEHDQFLEAYKLTNPEPTEPVLRKADRNKIAFTFTAGIPPALFAALATFYEFYTSRLIAGMTNGLALVSSAIGIIAFEMTLLILPFIKGWVPKGKRWSLNLATLLAWLVSVIANITLTWNILLTTPEDSTIFMLRTAFVLVTGISGATLAVFLGESSGGMLEKTVVENAEKMDDYYAAVDQYHIDLDIAWKKSPEFKRIARFRKGQKEDMPTIDWRTVSDADKAWIATATVDEIMTEFQMVGDQRKTAVAWHKKARES